MKQENERYEEVSVYIFNQLKTKKVKEIEELLKKEKEQNMIAYRSVLDKQINRDKLIKDKNKVSNEDFDGSLLPSYVYNVPSQPIYKKASDSLQMFKEKMFKDANNIDTNKRIRRNGSLTNLQQDKQQGNEVQVFNTINHEKEYGKYKYKY